MQEFIQKAVDGLGASETSVRAATSGLLQLVRAQADAADTQRLMAALPGSAQLLSERRASETRAEGGILQGALKKAAGAASGKLGAALGLAGTLAESGLSKSQIGPFVSMFVEHAKAKAGRDVVARILGRVPELQQFVG